MSYNLVVGNDIESTYQLIFAVLSIQVLWGLGSNNATTVRLHNLEHA